MKINQLLCAIIASSFLLCLTSCQKNKKSSHLSQTQARHKQKEKVDRKQTKKEKQAEKKRKKEQEKVEKDAKNGTDQSKEKKRASLFGGKTINEMSYEELVEHKNNAINNKNIDGAIKSLELALRLCKDTTMIGKHSVELADLYFDNGELLKSELLYTEFSRLYPGSELVEYALYKAILSSFYATLDAQRDQTKTQETLALSDKFIERADVFKKYHPDVSKIRLQCQNKMVESEINIFNFYLNRGNLTSAQKRLDNIKKDWASKLPELEPQLASLQQTLDAQKQAKTPSINSKVVKSKKSKIAEQKTELASTDAQPTDTPSQTTNTQVAKTKNSFVNKF